MDGHWRPHYNPTVVDSALEIIRNDLHSNTGGICTHATGRVTATYPDMSRELKEPFKAVADFYGGTA